MIFFFLLTFFRYIFASPVMATFDVTDPQYGGLAVTDKFGSISSVDTGLVLSANLLIYIGGAASIIGILAVLGLTIFKAVGTDDSEVLKEVRGGIVKALIVALIGLLITGAGFFITLSNDIVGEDAEVYTGT